MIVRIKKRTNPFVQIDKRPLEDSRLSWKAKGLLAYLLSRPDDWKVRVNQLCDTSSDGRDSVQSTLKELSFFGYAKLEVVRENGLLMGKEWVIFETPTNGFSVCRATDKRVFRRSGNPSVGKSATTNKESTNKESTNNNSKEKEIFSEKESEAIKVEKEGNKPLRREILTVIEAVKLIDRLNEERPTLIPDLMMLARWKGDWRQEAISFFSHYLKTNGKNHKCHTEPELYFEQGFVGWLQKSKSYARKSSGNAKDKTDTRSLDKYRNGYEEARRKARG